MTKGSANQAEVMRPLLYDYTKIKHEQDREFLKDTARKVHDLRDRNSREIGVLLRDAQHRRPSQFVEWLKTEFQMPTMTAYRCIGDAKFTEDQFTTVVKMAVVDRYQLSQIADETKCSAIIAKYKAGDLRERSELQKEIRKARKAEDKVGTAKTPISGDTKGDRQKRQDRAGKAVAILLEDLSSDRFEEFQKLYLPLPDHYLREAMWKVRAANSTAPSIVKAAAEPAAATTVH